MSTSTPNGRFPRRQAQRPKVHTPHSLGMFVQACSWASSRPERDAVDRLLFERQGVRLGRATDPARVDRCSGGRWGRHVVRQRAVRLQLAGTGGARTPCRPFDAERVTASAWAKPPASRWSSAQTSMRLAAQARFNYWVTEKPATPTTCRRRTPKALGAEHALDDALARDPACRRPMRSTTSTCTAPPAPRTTRSKRALVAQALSGDHACQLHQGLHRPHAWCGWRAWKR